MGPSTPLAQNSSWVGDPIQLPPAQHGWFSPPQTQTPLLQVKPVPQMLPAQHGCPPVPQAWQVPVLHMRSALQALFGQQG
jgi:hypothetical protein